MAIERWYPQQRPALLKDFQVSKDLKDSKDLRVLAPDGNLTDEERNILRQCIENNN